MLSEVVTCNCVRNPGAHAESNPRPSEEGVSFYHVLRPLDRHVDTLNEWTRTCSTAGVTIGAAIWTAHVLGVSRSVPGDAVRILHWPCICYGMAISP